MIGARSCFWSDATGSLAPNADLIRRTAGEVVHRPEFRLSPRQDAASLILYLLDRVEAVFNFLRRLWDLSPVLACVVVVILIAVIVALAVEIVSSIRRARAGVLPESAALAKGRKQLDPAQLEYEAEVAARRQDYIGAVRLLFRAAVVRLEQRAGRTARPGTTNHEYLSRYRSAGFIEALRQFVEVIDAKWYGHGLCDANDYERCRAAHALIRQAAGASS